MKRSEMIELIQDTWGQSQHDDSWYDKANHLLSVIEKAGMLPPKYCYRSDRYIDGHTSKYDRYYKNEWEPEDE